MTQNINYYHPSVNKFKIKNQYTEIGYDYYNNLSNNPCKCENYTTTTPSIQHYFFDCPTNGVPYNKGIINYVY